MSSQLFSALKWVLFFFIAILFCLRVAHFVDPDLGWHLKAGELVTGSGWTAPRVDPWSYTLPSHDWVDHEWLVDGIFYQAESHGAWAIVTLAFTLLSLLVPFLWFRHAENILALVTVLLASGLLLSIVGVRPQVLSVVLFFLSYEVLLTNNPKWQKLTYLSPLFFWMWANLHAGFPAGLFLFAIVVGEALYTRFTARREDARSPREIYTLIALFLTSTLATLLTPYHTLLWQEIITSSLNPLNSSINEWTSPLFDMPKMGIAFLILAVGMVYAARKSIARVALWVAVFFALLYLRHMRMLPFFLISMVPLASGASDYFYETFTRTKILVRGFDMVRFALFNLVVIAVVVIYPSFALEGEVTAPYQPARDAFMALNTLEQYHALGNVYNSYGFGGWLIHDHSIGRVFSDGRSPHWKDANGFSPFGTQVAIERHGDDFHSTFADFGIHTAIVLNQPHEGDFVLTPLAMNFALNHPTLFAIIRSLFIGEHAPTLVDTLRANGWCTLYQDEQAVILRERGSTFCFPKKKDMSLERFVFTGRVAVFF